MVYFGAWLSSVERCVRDAEVPGSNPGAPTSVLFQKYLDHNAMDGYMGVHGYDNQEVAAATG